MNTKITNGNYFCLKDIENYLISNKELLGSKVLDFGCGDSPYYELLKPINYTGVDLEINQSISTYKNLLKIEKNKTLPFENSKFDSIIATQVIYQIESLDKLIIDFHRILNKKGLVLVTVPFMWSEVYDNMHPNKRFSKNELHDIFKKQGFELIDFKPLNNGLEGVLILFLKMFESNINSLKIPVIRPLIRVVFCLSFNCIIGIVRFIKILKDPVVYLNSGFIFQKKDD